MIIKRTSMYSGITREMDINVTNEQVNAWMEGECIQNAMPNLTDDEREFIMTGMTQADWDAVCSEENFMESLDELDESHFSF